MQKLRNKLGGLQIVLVVGIVGLWNASRRSWAFPSKPMYSASGATSEQIRGRDHVQEADPSVIPPIIWDQEGSPPFGWKKTDSKSPQDDANVTDEWRERNAWHAARIEEIRENARQGIISPRVDFSGVIDRMVGAEAYREVIT